MKTKLLLTCGEKPNRPPRLSTLFISHYYKGQNNKLKRYVHELRYYFDRWKWSDTRVIRSFYEGVIPCEREF
jgi:hypothetical protein